MGFINAKKTKNDVDVNATLKKNAINKKVKVAKGSSFTDNSTNIINDDKQIKEIIDEKTDLIRTGDILDCGTF